MGAVVSLSGSLDFYGLFDWTADQLRIATPGNILNTLRKEQIRDFPIRHQNTVLIFREWSSDTQEAKVRRWYTDLVPGTPYMFE